MISPSFAWLRLINLLAAGKINLRTYDHTSSLSHIGDGETDRRLKVLGLSVKIHKGYAAECPRRPAGFMELVGQLLGHVDRLENQSKLVTDLACRFASARAINACKSSIA